MGSAAAEWSKARLEREKINENPIIPGWPPGLGNPKEKHFKFNLRKGGAFRKMFAYFHFALNDFVAGS